MKEHIYFIQYNHFGLWETDTNWTPTSDLGHAKLQLSDAKVSYPELKWRILEVEATVVAEKD